MKILFTGKGGKAGSWKVRSEQLGTALGATVRPLATIPDLQACDIAVVVKRTPREVLDALKATRKPWVFDIVDCYPQPESSAWSRKDAVAWAQELLRRLKPTGVVWPNQRMRDDCNIGLPGVVIPHHFRPGIKLNPIREQIQAVGYEGAERYLAHWRRTLEDECRRRGWRFVVNPAHLADVDIVVAFRGAEWNGYVSRHWKSNVKLANAHGSGTPFIGQHEDGYAETASGAEYWAEDLDDLRTSFNWLEAQSTREQVRDRFLESAYPVERAAKELEAFLARL